MKDRVFIKVVMAALFAAAGMATLVNSNVQASNVSETATLSESGEELFKANCARCHGNSGEGGKGPNLTTEKKKAKWKDSDEKLVAKIKKGGLFMPSFKDKLGDSDIKLIAEHVRQLPPASK